MLPSEDYSSLPVGYEGPVEITGAEDLEEVFHFRAEVWGGEDWLPAPPNSDRIWDRFDFLARHWVVRHQGELVAAMRVSLHGELSELPDNEYFPEGLVIPIPPPIACFNRLVVDAAHRFQGIGTALDRLSISVAAEAGANAVIEIIPPYRVPALHKLGFRVLSRTRYPYAGEIPATIMLFDLQQGKPSP